MAEDLDVASSFQRVARLWYLQHWSLEQEGEVTVSHCRDGEKSCMVRIQFEVPLAYKYKALTLRPHFVCEHSGSTMLFDVRMIKELSQSDAIVSVRFCLESLAHAVTMLVGGHQEMRLTFRRDWPQPGHRTALLSPPNPGGAVLIPGFLFMYYYIVTSELPDPTRCMSSHFIDMPWPSYPQWATSLLTQIGQAEIKMTSIFSQRSDFFDLVEKCYVVLCLQSCSRGPPLLPCSVTSDGVVQADSFIEDVKVVNVGGFAWVPAQHKGFNFTEYLRRLLQALGLSVQIWDEIDGRRLVPYQACLLGSDWDRVSQSFVETFSAQRAAYRRMHGGKNAPKVKPTLEPHFLDGVWATLSATPELDLDLVEERNTFINVLEPLKVSIGGLHMRRGYEAP